VAIDPDFFVDLRLDHLDLDEVLARCPRVASIERRSDGRWVETTA
jgi:hypothetical protein